MTNPALHQGGCIAAAVQTHRVSMTTFSRRPETHARRNEARHDQPCSPHIPGRPELCQTRRPGTYRVHSHPFNKKITGRAQMTPSVILSFGTETESHVVE